MKSALRIPDSFAHMSKKNRALSSVIAPDYSIYGDLYKVHRRVSQLKIAGFCCLYVFYKKTRTANVEVIRISRRNGERYLGVFEKLIANRGNIVSDVFTFADITLACHLSSLDYLGEINWQTYPSLKDWYSVIKSKPVFRDLLYDSLQDIRPAEHYRELDF